MSRKNEINRIIGELTSFYQSEAYAFLRVAKRKGATTKELCREVGYTRQALLKKYPIEKEVKS